MIVYQLGLAMFVYVIGLSAGPAFFSEFAKKGWKLTIFMLLLLATLIGLAWVLIKSLGLDAAIGTGMFTGALTSTPGMAAVVELIEGIDPSLASEPVIGYS